MAIISNPNWDALAAQVRKGTFASKHSPGDEFYVPYGSYTMPMIYSHVSGDGVVFYSKYALPESSGYSSYSGASKKYSTSTARSFILNTVLGQFGSEFTKHLSNFTVNTATYGGGTDTVQDKMWLPSSNEMGALSGGSFDTAAQAAVEGQRFYGFSALNSDSPTAARAIPKVSDTETPVIIWLRSNSMNNGGYHLVNDSYGEIRGAGNPAQELAIMVACYFTGGDAPEVYSQLYGPVGGFTKKIIKIYGPEPLGIN